MATHAIPAIRWEAARSIGLVGMATPEALQTLQNLLRDENGEVGKAAQKALEELGTVKKRQVQSS